MIHGSQRRETDDNNWGIPNISPWPCALETVLPSQCLEDLSEDEKKCDFPAWVNAKARSPKAGLPLHLPLKSTLPAAIEARSHDACCFRLPWKEAAPLNLRLEVLCGRLSTIRYPSSIGRVWYNWKKSTQSISLPCVPDCWSSGRDITVGRGPVKPGR